MEEGNSPVRRWKNLNIDTLVNIFESFDLFQLVSVISQVYPSWQSSFSDQRLWKNLYLSVMQSNFIIVSIPRYIYVKTPSRENLTRIFIICLNLCRGIIVTLIIHYHLYVDNNQLTYTAKRCPRIKCLVMPAWDKLEKQTICSAFHEWKDFESLMVHCLEEPAYVIKKIGRSYKKNYELNIMNPCYTLFASSFVSYFPNMKVLSLRCTELSKPALVILLQELKKLNVLNVSHCIITEYLPPPAPMKILTEIGESILEKTSRLDIFLTCMSDSCIMCQRTQNDERFHKVVLVCRPLESG